MAAEDRLVHTVLAGKNSCGLKYFWPGFVGLGCNFPVFSHNFVWVSVFFNVTYFLVLMVPVDSLRFWP